MKPKIIKLSEKKKKRGKSLGPPAGQNFLYFIEKVWSIKEKSDK